MYQTVIFKNLYLVVEIKQLLMTEFHKNFLEVLQRKKTTKKKEVSCL